MLLDSKVDSVEPPLELRTPTSSRALGERGPRDSLRSIAYDGDSAASRGGGRILAADSSAAFSSRLLRADCAVPMAPPCDS